MKKWIALFWLAVFAFAACSPASTPAAAVTQEPTAAPALSEVTSTSPAPPTRGPDIPSTRVPDQAVQTTQAQIPAQARVGQLEISYPPLLSPGGSKTLEAAVYLPAELVNADPEPFTREIISSSPSPLPGRYETYRALVFLTPSMRAELVAPGFSSTELYPASQAVDLATPNTVTYWAWAIVAPQQPQEYMATVRLFLAGEEAPRWVGSFTIIVAAATPTQAPTPTPTPAPSGADALIDGLGKVTGVIAALGALLTAIVGLFKLISDARKKDKA